MSNSPAQTETNQPSQACSWYEFRFNVVPYGPEAHAMQAQFRDTLDQARTIKTQMIAAGADEVHIFDTVDGLFY